MASQAEQRGLAQAKLRINKHDDIWFFNTHLSAAGFTNGQNGTTERTQQVRGSRRSQPPARARGLCSHHVPCVTANACSRTCVAEPIASQRLHSIDDVP